jgi:hypothetical protein
MSPMTARQWRTASTTFPVPASPEGNCAYERASGWSSKASEAELKGGEGGDLKRAVGGENRREKSLRIGVHHADAVVWGPV